MSNPPDPLYYWEIDTTRHKYSLRKMGADDKYTVKTQLWWPEANTDNLRTAADAWSGLGSNLDYVADQLDRQVEFLTASWSGDAQVGFREMWNQWTSPVQIPFQGTATTPPGLQKGHLREAADDCRGLSQALSNYATQVDHYRDELLAMVAGTVVAIGVGIGLTVWTAGASDAAATEAGAALATAASNLGLELSDQAILVISRIAANAYYDFLAGLLIDVAGHVTYNEVYGLLANHTLSDPLAGVTIQEMVSAGVTYAATAGLFRALSTATTSDGLPAPPNPDGDAPSPSVPQLTPGEPFDMYQQAKDLCLQAPASQRADLFAAFEKQIEEKGTSNWSAQEYPGTNGERIFVGRLGESLVFDKDGNMFRGKMPDDFTYVPDKRQDEPNYAKLRRLN